MKLHWLLAVVVLALWILMISGMAAQAQDWKSVDIGDTKAGSTNINGGTITVVANGADIWGAADAFRFVYREGSGDFEISARLVSQERANEWSKAGLMARQSLEANSPNAFLNVTPDYGVKLIHRDVVGGTTGPSPWEKNFEAPVWLKLARTGNEFSSFWSEDGQNWEAAEVVGTPSVATIEMTDALFVGIAVTSHVANTLSEAVIDNIRGGGGLALSVEPVAKLAVTWARVRTHH